MIASREVREEALIRYAKDVLSHPLHFSPTIVIRAKKILHKYKAHLEPHIYGSLNPHVRQGQKGTKIKIKADDPVLQKLIILERMVQDEIKAVDKRIDEINTRARLRRLEEQKWRMPVASTVAMDKNPLETLREKIERKRREKLLRKKSPYMRFYAEDDVVLARVAEELKKERLRVGRHPTSNSLNPNSYNKMQYLKYNEKWWIRPGSSPTFGLPDEQTEDVGPFLSKEKAKAWIKENQKRAREDMKYRQRLAGLNPGQRLMRENPPTMERVISEKEEHFAKKYEQKYGAQWHYNKKLKAQYHKEIQDWLNFSKKFCGSYWVELAEFYKLRKKNPCCAGETMYNPPVWAERGVWRKAESVVKPYWERYQTPYAVVADVYKKMGGRVMKRRKRRGNPELLMVENPRKKRRRGRGRFHCHYGRKPSYFAFVRKMWKKHGRKLRRMRSMGSRMRWIGATYRRLLK